MQVWSSFLESAGSEALQTGEGPVSLDGRKEVLTRHVWDGPGHQARLEVPSPAPRLLDPAVLLGLSLAVGLLAR